MKTKTSQARKVPKANRRGSPDVVEKRAAARRFNEVLLGKKADGRTERRRMRLLEELARGAARGGRPLKPIDVLARVKELLELDEPLTAIRKACPPPRLVEATDEVLEGVRRLHEAYAFPAAAYRFVGLDDVLLRKAGVLPGRPDGPGLAPARPSPGRAGRRGAA